MVQEHTRSVNAPQQLQPYSPNIQSWTWSHVAALIKHQCCPIHDRRCAGVHAKGHGLGEVRPQSRMHWRAHYT
jgi:hypothetical protein